MNWNQTCILRSVYEKETRARENAMEYMVGEYADLAKELKDYTSSFRHKTGRRPKVKELQGDLGRKYRRYQDLKETMLIQLKLEDQRMKLRDKKDFNPPVPPHKSEVAYTADKNLNSSLHHRIIAEKDPQKLVTLAQHLNMLAPFKTENYKPTNPVTTDTYLNFVKMQEEEKRALAEGKRRGGAGTKWRERPRSASRAGYATPEPSEIAFSETNRQKHMQRQRPGSAVPLRRKSSVGSMNSSLVSRASVSKMYEARQYRRPYEDTDSEAEAWPHHPNHHHRSPENRQAGSRSYNRNTDGTWRTQQKEMQDTSGIERPGRTMYIDEEHEPDKSNFRSGMHMTKYMKRMLEQKVDYKKTSH